MEEENKEGIQVIWSGELDPENMIIDLGSDAEELCSNLPTAIIPTYIAADHTQDALSEMMKSRPADEESEAEKHQDSDYIPEENHLNESQSDSNKDDDCSEDAKGKKVKRFFQSNKRQKPRYDLDKIYDFAEESEEETEKEEQPEDSDSDEDDKLATEKTSNKKNERRWNKLHACKFCPWVGTGKLKLHLLAKHKTEEEVMELLKWEKDPLIKIKTKQDRKADKPRREKLSTLLAKIRYDGMQKHNMDLIVNGKRHKDPKKNNLLVKRRQRSERGLNDVLHCTKCNVCISRHQLAVHMKKAHSIKAGRNCQSQAKAREPIVKAVEADFERDVMNTLQCGAERLQIRQDKLIIIKGEKLYESRNSEDHPRHLETCRNRMRELARLVIQARQFEPKIATLEDLMVPQKYDLIVVATKELHC